MASSGDLDWNADLAYDSINDNFYEDRYLKKEFGEIKEHVLKDVRKYSQVIQKRLNATQGSATHYQFEKNEILRNRTISN